MQVKERLELETRERLPKNDEVGTRILDPEDSGEAIPDAPAQEAARPAADEAAMLWRS